MYFSFSPKDGITEFFPLGVPGCVVDNPVLLIFYTLSTNNNFFALFAVPIGLLAGSCSADIVFFISAFLRCSLARSVGISRNVWMTSIFSPVSSGVRTAS